MSRGCAIGLDFGTNSVRAVVVDADSGEEIGTGVWNYAHGEDGIILKSGQPLLARQHPADYIEGLKCSLKDALQEASGCDAFSPDAVVGIGVDTTGSTPLPVDSGGEPLAFSPEYCDNPDAMAWLWKDHTGYAEADCITRAARRLRPDFLKKCGGVYSPEWFWAKALRCLRVAPEVFDSAFTWVELCDWIPAVLTGTASPDDIKRGVCAAGHKGMYNPQWGGYPDEEFLASIDPGLAQLRRTLPDAAYDISSSAGMLTSEWARHFGLAPGIPVAVGALDGHLGAVGSGIAPGTLVKIMGTSGCDMMVSRMDEDIPDVPGLCGIVPGGILPGCFGLEAGQSALGDIYNWFVNSLQPGGPEAGTHQALTRGAEAILPGESGLLGLDWHNGNRTVLVDQRLSGLLLGMTLHTTPAQIYRALIESTAFGARMIMERFQQYGLDVERVRACGGIARKNPLVMQIHADIMNREIEVVRSSESCALGAAIAGAVAAGRYECFGDALARMGATTEHVYRPDDANTGVYDRLFAIYSRLHDVYGRKGCRDGLYDVMKDLLSISEAVKEGIAPL